MLDLHGDVRQIGEFRQFLPVMRRPVRAAGCDRDNGAEMARSKPPKMQVGDLIALAFDCRADLFRHPRIRRAIEQDAAVSRSNPNDQFAITSAPIRPASGSIQSQPNARAVTSPTMTRTDTAASAMT